MKANLQRRPPPAPQRRYPSLSDKFGREPREAQSRSSLQAEDTFWTGYVRLIAFILFVVVIATIAAKA